MYYVFVSQFGSLTCCWIYICFCFVLFHLVCGVIPESSISLLTFPCGHSSPGVGRLPVLTWNKWHFSYMWRSWGLGIFSRSWAFTNTFYQTWGFSGQWYPNIQPKAVTLRLECTSETSGGLFKNRLLSGLVWLRELGMAAQSGRSSFWFPGRAHTWVAGLSPGGGMQEATDHCFSLILSPSLPLPLKINK